LKVRLRKYQEKALKIALEKRRCVIVMPTGSGKTIVAGAWLEELFKRGLTKALVLEPTRILVEQTTVVFNELFDLEAKALHGGKAESSKKEALKAKVIVATPEEAELWLDELKGAEALVVDECHHTVGKDPYVKVVKELRAEWRLGLSAFIPPRRRRLIEEYIGEIVEIGWEELKEYLPEWIGEIYEAPLAGPCKDLYEELLELWRSGDKRQRLLASMAIRFLVRDGALALLDSAKRESKLAHMLRKLRNLEPCVKVQPLHKFDALRRALDDHPFEKALVFIDRVVVAEEVAKRLGASLLVGRRWRESKLGEVKEARIIVSTSAGEEGIDLPEMDLLVLWSNTASTLRLIQRIGRLLRPKPGKLKFMVFIVTPETIDTDLLIEALIIAKRIGVDPHVDVNVLRKILARGSVANILESLRGRPLPEDVIAELAGLSKYRVRRVLKRMGEEGIVAYLHSPWGRLWFLQEDWESVYEYPELVEPLEGAKVRVEELGIKGSPEEVAKELRRRVPVGPLTLSVRARTKSMEIFDVRKYDFVIKEEEVAEIVAKNAASKGLLMG